LSFYGEKVIERVGVKVFIGMDTDIVHVFQDFGYVVVIRNETLLMFYFGKHFELPLVETPSGWFDSCGNKLCVCTYVCEICLTFVTKQNGIYYYKHGLCGILMADHKIEGNMWDTCIGLISRNGIECNITFISCEDNNVNKTLVDGFHGLFNRIANLERELEAGEEEFRCYKEHAEGFGSLC